MHLFSENTIGLIEIGETVDNFDWAAPPGRTRPVAIRRIAPPPGQWNRLPARLAALEDELRQQYTALRHSIQP